MKRGLTVLCASLAFSWVAVAGAQTYGQSGQSTSDKSSHAKQSREVTLSGCLSEGADAKFFVLSNASEGGQASSSMGSSSMAQGSATGEQQQTGTSGETSTEQNMSSGNQTPMTFQLVAGRHVDLKKYVGQRVEIRGVVEPMKEKAEKTGTSGSTGNEQSGGSMGSSTSGSQTNYAGTVTHRVKVSSVKSLGSSCQ